MKYVALFFTLLFPVVLFAQPYAGSASQRPPLTMLLFVIGAVAAMLFLKGRQSPDHHTGFIPIFQSVVITVCFAWSHYILLVVDRRSLLDFYSNIILHIDQSLVAFFCVLLLYVGFGAVLYRAAGIGLAKLKQRRSRK